ncbi:5987_t:CDS:2, partial [Acaulospora colombiana]
DASTDNGRRRTPPKAKCSVLQLEHENSGVDYVLSAKAINPSPIDGSGVYVGSLLQSITKRLALGVETYYQRAPDGGDLAATYSFKYTGGPTTPEIIKEGSMAGPPGSMVAPSDQWIATCQFQAIGLLQASYWHKLSPQVEVAADLQVIAAPMKRDAVATVGAKWDLRMASFRAQFDSTGKVSAMLEQRFAPNFSFLMTGEIDHFKAGLPNLTPSALHPLSARPPGSHPIPNFILPRPLSGIKTIPPTNAPFARESTLESPEQRGARTGTFKSSRTFVLENVVIRTGASFLTRETHFKAEPCGSYQEALQSRASLKISLKKRTCRLEGHCLCGAMEELSTQTFVFDKPNIPKYEREEPTEISTYENNEGHMSPIPGLDDLFWEHMYSVERYALSQEEYEAEFSAWLRSYLFSDSITTEIATEVPISYVTHAEAEDPPHLPDSHLFNPASPPIMTNIEHNTKSHLCKICSKAFHRVTGAKGCENRHRRVKPYACTKKCGDKNWYGRVSLLTRTDTDDTARGHLQRPRNGADTIVRWKQRRSVREAYFKAEPRWPS